MEPMIYFSFSLIFLPPSAVPGSKNVFWARCSHGSDTWKPGHFLQSLPLFRPPCQTPCCVQPHPAPPGLHCSTCPHPACHHPLPSEENAIIDPSHLQIQFLFFFIIYHFCSFLHSEVGQKSLCLYYALLLGFYHVKSALSNSDSETLKLYEALNASYNHKFCFHLQPH